MNTTRRRFALTHRQRSAAERQADAICAKPGPPMAQTVSTAILVTGGQRYEHVLVDFIGATP